MTVPMVLSRSGVAVPNVELAEGLSIAHYVEPFLGWCDGVREHSPNTVNAYRRALTLFVDFCDRHGVRTPAAVKVRTVEAYIMHSRRDRGLSIQTVNQHRAALTTFFRFLLHDEIVQRNPAAEAYAMKKPQTIPDFLTAPEQEHVLRTLGQIRTASARQRFALVATGLLTGLRISELCHVESDHVRLDDPVRSHLKVVDGKGHKQRIVPIIPWLRRVLLRHAADVRPRLRHNDRVPYLFVAPRCAEQAEAANPRSVYATIRGCVSPLIGRNCHPHMLRHSFATRLLAAGASLEHIRVLMGHSRLETVSIYVHIPADSLHQKVARWLSPNLAALEDAVEATYEGAVAPPDVDVPDFDNEEPADTLPPLEAVGVDVPTKADPSRSPFPFADPRVRARLRERRYQRRGR